MVGGGKRDGRENHVALRRQRRGGGRRRRAAAFFSVATPPSAPLSAPLSAPALASASALSSTMVRSVRAGIEVCSAGQEGGGACVSGGQSLPNGLQETGPLEERPPWCPRGPHMHVMETSSGVPTVASEAGSHRSHACRSVPSRSSGRCGATDKRLIKLLKAQCRN